MFRWDDSLLLSSISLLRFSRGIDSDPARISKENSGETEVLPRKLDRIVASREVS